VDESAAKLSNPSELASTGDQSVLEFAYRSLHAAEKALSDLQAQQNQAKRLVRQALDALQQLPTPATIPLDSPHQSPFLSVAEVANSYGVSRTQVWRMVQEGTVPSCKLGQRVVVPRDALKYWDDVLDGLGLG
jgi:excisionase family DNA binding protein